MSEMFSTVDVLHRALDYHAKRHNLLSSNVANADTPGFRPAELLRVPEEHLASNLPLARTESGHQRPAGDSADPQLMVLEDQSAQVGADGNGVSIDREMAKISANNVRYDSAAKLVRQKLAMLRYAATDGAR